MRCQLGGVLAGQRLSRVGIFESGERPIIVSFSEEQAARDGVASIPRQGRRLSDKILVAFHHACDVGDYEVSESLLQVLELMLTRRPLPADLGRRRSMESLVAAHERLWNLRNPDDAS